MNERQRGRRKENYSPISTKPKEEKQEKWHVTEREKGKNANYWNRRGKRRGKGGIKKITKVSIMT